MEQLCYYCKKLVAVDGPRIDTDGIGWMPNCLTDSCEYRAELETKRQQKARQIADNPKILSLKKPYKFDTRRP